MICHRFARHVCMLALISGAVVRADSIESPSADGAARPNVVLIFIDDLGYADIGPFSTGGTHTPNLDRLAATGMKFTDFVVSSAVCSASRVGLMTGCNHRRVGIDGALGPQAEHGLHQDETTLAEICRQQAYATACFGKWHLGHHPKFLPLQHGFDEFFGLPYSNDMWPLHPEYAQLPPQTVERKQGYPPLPLIEGNGVVNPRVSAADQAQLTTWYTERAVTFIERHRERPFFLYVPHTMVHVPLFVSDKYLGRGGGLFGDVVMEVDWSVGQILDALERCQLSERTLVIFTSDNGPWLSYGDHAGSAGTLREGKGTNFEGGFRVPTLMRWPGKIPAGTACDELASTLDILPTVAKLIDSPLPKHPLDGKDISPLLFAQPGAESPHQAFYYYYDGGELQAVRDRRWKLHFPHAYRTLADRRAGTGGTPASYVTARIGLNLYDLKQDPGETTNLATQNPAIVRRLRQLAEAARDELGDALTDRVGRGVRPAGHLESGDERLTW